MSSSKPFSPTPEQVAIAEALKDGGNMAIDAGAGTGKSSTLLYLVKEHISRSQGVLMCVFNKRNQEELQEKLGKANLQKASAKTFAAMAYSAFWKRYPKSLKAGDFPDQYKYRRLARWWVAAYLPSGRTPEMLKEAAKVLQDLVTMFMVNTTHNHQDGRLSLFIGGSLNDEDSLMSHSYEGGHSIAYMYGLYLDYSDDEGKTTEEIERMELEDMQALVEKGLPDLIHFGRLAFHAPQEAAGKLRDLEGKLLRDGLDLGNGWVDFLDMMYWCVVERWTVWQSQWVLVDEAQDLSPLERALVNMHLAKVSPWFKTPGRLIMVGDPQQAINAFKGADNEGFLNSQIFWQITNVKPLSVCWRCFREIVELAAGHKEGFKAAPNAISGIIAPIHDDDLIKLVKDGDAIISRLRSATIVWWRKLVKAGIACKILGQNPADTVIRLLEKISSFEGFKFETLKEHLDTYQKTQVEKLTKKNKGEAEILAVVDEVETVRAMIEDIEAASMEDLIAKVRDELDPRKMPNGGVSIMTGHGSKGGEWNQVFNVTPDKFPLITRDQSPASYIQELNLRYVVQTRSMQAYFLVSPKHDRYDPTKPVQQTLPKGVPYDPQLGIEYDPMLDDDEDEWEDPVDEGFEWDWQASQKPAITVEPVPVPALPAPTVDLITFADAVKSDPDKPLFEPLMPRIQAIDEAQGITPVSPVGEKETVVEEPKFKATGTLAKDMKAFKATKSAQAEAQSKVFDLLKRLDLDTARSMRDLLEAHIEELEAELEPA